MNYFNLFTYLTMLAVGIIIWYIIVYYILDIIERWLWWDGFVIHLKQKHRWKFVKKTNVKDVINVYGLEQHSTSKYPSIDIGNELDLFELKL